MGVRVRVRVGVGVGVRARQSPWSCFAAAWCSCMVEGGEMSDLGVTLAAASSSTRAGGWTPSALLVHLVDT